MKLNKNKIKKFLLGLIIIRLWMVLTNIDVVAGIRTEIVKRIRPEFLVDGYDLSGGFKIIEPLGVLGVEIRLQPVSPKHATPANLAGKIRDLIPDGVDEVPVVVSFLPPIYNRQY